MDNTIKLTKDDRLVLEIETDEGIKTGESLVFDLEDIELPLKYQKMIEEEKKNRNWLKNQEIIISKKQETPKKGTFMTSKELEKIKVLNSFFNKEIEIYNMFLGENGVQKLLNGRKMGWTRLREIDKVIETYIVPKLKIKKDTIINKIETLYSNLDDKRVIK